MKEQMNPTAPVEGIPFDPTNYAARIDKGLLYWGEENGKPVLFQKMFDNAHNELAPIPFHFSVNHIAKLRLSYDGAILDIDRQILDLEERKQNLIDEKTSVCDTLEKDVKKAEADIAKKKK